MEYRSLGNAGVKVSRICIGAGVRGQLDEDLFTKSIETAIDLGCNFIDCANVYGGQQAQALLGRILQGKRDDLVVASKVGSRVGDGPNDEGLSRHHIMAQVERTLRELQTDRIDLYYMHHPDPRTPLDETLRTMEELVRQGKVRYIGASNFTAAGVTELLWTADKLGLEKVACLQNHYNLLHRDTAEPELFSVCERHNIGFTTYSATAVGLLTGQFRRGRQMPEHAVWSNAQLESMLTPHVEQVVQTLVSIADERGATPTQVAIAWILNHEEVTAPIIGAESPAYVREAMGALEINLTSEERVTLDKASLKDGPGGNL
ncbi:MAG: aldo/keto reductase [Dehalococcoidia bacterium]